MSSMHGNINLTLSNPVGPNGNIAGTFTINDTDRVKTRRELHDEFAKEALHAFIISHQIGDPREYTEVCNKAYAIASVMMNARDMSNRPSNLSGLAYP